MKDILELVSRLKQDKYKFTFDGEDMFEFPFGTLKISMFIEYDDDQRPVCIQYITIIDDDSDFSFDNPIYSDTLDNYDLDTSSLLDLNIEDVILKLDDSIQNVKEKNLIITKIQKHINSIEEIINENDDDESIGNIVKTLINNSIIMDF